MDLRAALQNGGQRVRVGQDTGSGAAMFLDRVDAGRKLASQIATMKLSQPIVFALPRGGVPVGAEVARVLGAPLDVLVVRKIGVPFQPELALGAIADGERPVVACNEDVLAASGVSAAEFEQLAEAQRAEIARRKLLYGGVHAAKAVAGRDVVLVDDGLATGATAKVAIAALRHDKPARIILAVPVASPETLLEMHNLVEAVVCLETPRWFTGVGAYYGDFRQVADEEVIATLASFRARVPCQEPTRQGQGKPDGQGSR